MNILITTFLISILINLFFFFFASFFRSDKVTDLSYSLSFIVIVLYFLLFTDLILSQVMLVFMIIIWGVRLGGYLFMRIRKIGKDKRFDGIRENFFKFAQFWIFQAITVWVILIPTILYLSSSNVGSFRMFSLLGFCAWFLGLIIESIADQEKFVFKNNPRNKDKWIDSGLWKYSRYPNYFGEMLCWWGIFFYVFPYLKGLQYASISGPVFITFILIFVSGIPLLEKKYDKKFKNNPRYQQYKLKTNLLIPIPKFTERR